MSVFINLNGEKWKILTAFGGPEIVACHAAVLELWNLSHRKTVWEFGKRAEKQTNKQVLLHAAASGTECDSLARGKKMNGTLHQIALCVYAAAADDAHSHSLGLGEKIASRARFVCFLRSGRETACTRHIMYTNSIRTHSRRGERD